MIIVINFADSDFYNAVLEAAKNYCNNYKESFEYCHNDPKYIKGLIERYSDIEHIKGFFIKQVVGEWIKNLERDRELNTSMFEHILKCTKSMFNDDSFTIFSDCEFDKSQLGYCEYLVLYFQNNNLEYDIF